MIRTTFYFKNQKPQPNNKYYYGYSVEGIHKSVTSNIRKIRTNANVYIIGDDNRTKKAKEKIKEKKAAKTQSENAMHKVNIYIDI